MINHKNFQSDSSSPSLYKFAIKFTMGITIRKKTIVNGSSANLRPLFNSNVTKVSVIKWSYNWTRTKHVKITSFAYIFQMFGYGNKITYDGPSAIPRPLYNRYLCHITIEKWSQICTRTIRKCLFKDILFLGASPIVIPIVNSISNLNHEWVELSRWNYSWLINAPKEPIKKHQPVCLNDFNKYWHVSCTRCHVFLLIIIFYKLVI